MFLGLTMILVGYFMIWLPGPSVGLQIIGIELGEWIKFLQAGARRDWFYLPPIIIGLVIALLAATWPNSDIKTWLARGLAVAVALLSFPAVAAIQLEPAREWLARLLAIALVAGIAAAGALVAARASKPSWIWLIISAVALIGALLPTIQYVVIRPAVEEALRRLVGFGPGVWLNAGGSLLVATIALAEFWRARQTKRTATG